MANTNPFSISYGDLTVGGSSSTYLLNGPHVVDKSFDRLRIVFEVVVVADSYENLHSLSEDLENGMRARDISFTISLDGSDFEYTSGSTALNVRGSAQKTGNAETDRGYSRAYQCTIEAELPADDADGLRELEVNVAYAPSRQKTVSMRGSYTALGGSTASAKYTAEFDSEASTILTALDAGAVWEMADEQFTRDRLNHVCGFSRQYVELLADQSGQGTDDVEIKDHRLTFSDMAQHPGDSAEEIHRLRRVAATYDCSVNIDQTTNLQDVWSQKVLPYVKDSFRSTFSPRVFAIEDLRISYDETKKQLSAAIQFIYQAASGSEVVEVAQSVAYREVRTIDYTPLHDNREFSAEADLGWSVLERVWSRTVVVLGAETPKRRLGQKAASGPAGLIDQTIGGQDGVDARDSGRVQRVGWNIVQNTSQVTPLFVGDPTHGQLRYTQLVETVVERYHEPAGGGGGGVITPGSG